MTGDYTANPQRCSLHECCHLAVCNPNVLAVAVVLTMVGQLMP